MIAVWSQFALCVTLIWAAGVRVSRYGDGIAEKANLSRTTSFWLLSLYLLNAYLLYLYAE